MIRAPGFWVFVLLAVVVSIAPAFAAAVPESQDRLIEFAPGKRAWMRADQIHALSDNAHKAGSCGGFFDVTDWPESRHESDKAWTTLDRALTPSFPQEVAQLQSFLSEARYEATIASLQGFWNRYYTTPDAVRSAEWIADQFRAASQGRADVSVQLFKHKGWPQPSVIVRLAGSDSTFMEAIVLGAHEDSINTRVSKPKRAGARAPGADDNASGSAAVLEVFRGFMQSGLGPKRDIYFMTYAAEEVGLLGSQEIAGDFKKRGVKVAAVLNLDMILYRGSAGKMGVTTSNTDKNLTKFTEKLIDRYVGAPRARRSCGYACSDHASWDRNGYRAVYLFETVDDISPWWHHPEDLLGAEQEAAWGMNFVKAAGAFAVELGLAAPF